MSRVESAVTEFDVAASELKAYFGRALDDVPTALLADALDRLCGTGFLISPSRHSELCAWYASKLHECERAADELLARLYNDDDEGDRP